MKIDLASEDATEDANPHEFPQPPKLSKIFAKWEIDAVLWDSQWAPSLEEILHQESLIDGEVQHQGRWRFARCSTGRISQ